MVSKQEKNIILGNVQLLNYCDNNNIDMQKLSDCDIERIGTRFIFVLRKNNNNLEPTLANDIDTQPDIVLTMEVENKNFVFSETEFTNRCK